MVEVVYKPYFTAESGSISPKVAKIDYSTLCILYGTPVFASGSAPGDDEILTIYTVPSGKVLLITSMTLSIASTALVKRTSYFYFQSSGGENVSSQSPITIGTPPNTSNSASVSPVIPIIVKEGIKITIFNEDPLAITGGGLSGYLLDLSLFRELL